MRRTEMRAGATWSHRPPARAAPAVAGIIRPQRELALPPIAKLITRARSIIDAPARLQPPPRLADAWQPLLIAVGLTLVYLYTSPRGIALEDDGFFVLTSRALGVAHPPGYPLYTLLASPFQYLPFGSLAWRIHAFSALCGGLTAAALWFSLRMLLPGSLPAVTGAVAFGLSLTFWSQAIIAEVYTLNTLLFALALALLLRADGAGDLCRRSTLRVAVLVIALSLANHWPLAILGSPLLLVLLWRRRRNLLADAPALLACALLGLTPYLWMLWRSHQPVTFTFAEPFTSLEQFWAYLSRAGYRDVDSSPTAGWLDKLGYLGLIARDSLSQLAWIGGAVALLGLLHLPRAWPFAIRLGLLASFLASSVVIALLLGFDDQPLNRSLFRVYPLIAWMVAAISMAAGIAWLRARVPAAGTAIAIGCMALPLLLHWPVNDRHDYRWAEDYAAAVLADLPQNATLYLVGDIALGTVAYTRAAQGIRPDVRLVSTGGDLIPDPPAISERAAGMDRTAALLHQIQSDPNPVAIIAAGPAITLPRQRTWLWSRLIRAREQGLPGYLLPPGQRRALALLLSADPPSDPWTRLAMQGLLTDYARLITLAESDAEFRAATPELDRLRGVANQGFHGRLARAELLLEAPGRDGVAEAGRLLADAASETDAPLGKQNLSRYFNAAARLLLSSRQQAEALALLERSVCTWPDRANPAVQSLRDYYRSIRAEPALDALNRRVPDLAD